MFLAEPPQSPYDLHFTMLGFPVRVHFLFWFAAAGLGFALGDPIFVALWVVATLLCILLHELGHAVVIQSYGNRASIVLYIFGGLAIPQPGRYNVRRPGPWGEMLIAFAGPASGFLLAAALVLGLHYLGGYPLAFYFHVVPAILVPNQFLSNFLNSVLQISVMWGLMNLLPVYPLDGGQIAQQVFVLIHPHDAMRQSLILSVIVGGMMCFIAFVQWQDFMMGLLFLVLTYSNFMTLQSQPGGWR